MPVKRFGGARSTRVIFLARITPVLQNVNRHKLHIDADNKKINQKNNIDAVKLITKPAILFRRTDFS